jgi:PIN domain nuclease of toxin-antitoxin system
VKVLLDTHALIWAVRDRSKLSERAFDAIVDPDNSTIVSAVSAWEIALKRRLGKLEFDGDFLAHFDTRVRDLGFEPIGLTSTHMIRGAEIEALHKDPFDRMLSGQALSEGLTIVSTDRAFKALGVPVLW